MKTWCLALPITAALSVSTVGVCHSQTPATDAPACIRPGDMARVMDTQVRDGKLTMVVYTWSDSKAHASALNAYQVDLKTGAAEQIQVPAGQTVFQTSPAPLRVVSGEGYSLSREGRKLTVCEGPNCDELALPPKRLEAGPAVDVDETVTVAFDDTGDWAVVSYRQAAQTWRRKGRKYRPQAAFQLGDDSNTIGHANFVGDKVHAIMAVCCGPGASGLFYDRKSGKRLGEVGGRDTINAIHAEATTTDDRHWAWLDGMTDELVVHRMRDMKVVARVAGDKMGQVPSGTTDNGPEGASKLAVIDQDNLVAVLGRNRIGQIVVLEARTAKVKARHLIPRCAK